MNYLNGVISFLKVDRYVIKQTFVCEQQMKMKGFNYPWFCFHFEFPWLLHLVTRQLLASVQFIPFIPTRYWGFVWLPYSFYVFLSFPDCKKLSRRLSSTDKKNHENHSAVKIFFPQNL